MLSTEAEHTALQGQTGHSASDQRKFLYLAGVHVTHSIAPPMHNYIASSLSLPWQFISQECPTIDDVLTIFRAATFAGGVVTMPYKKSIMPLLDELDPLAITIGACNNVYLTPEGRLRGTNTDWQGIKGCLLFGAKGKGPEAIGRAALIIGAGGASRAAVYALFTELGCGDIYIVNRDAQEVADLLEDTKAYASSPSSRKPQLIHVTSVAQAEALEAPFYVVGTVPDFEAKTEEEITARDMLTTFLKKKKKGVLLDMCFKPRNTRILQLGRNNGWTDFAGGCFVYIRRGRVDCRKHFLKARYTPPNTGGCKIHQAAAQDFQGIEIFYEDLEYLAREQSGLSAADSPSSTSLIQAAHTTKQLCDERKLVIIGLQPFLHYEGLRDRKAHAQRIEKLSLWFEIVKALGADIIQIPGNFLPEDEITGDLNVVVEDLRQVADLGAKQSPVVRFAYENLCWSTYFDTWEKAFDLVRRVDRENFGMCLDTFNIAGRVYADPTMPDGKSPNADLNLRRSLEEMVKVVDVKKVFYIQIVDAEKMRYPLVAGHAFHEEGQPARMSWSRNARLFAGEGGYLPVMDVSKAIITGLGYTGWISMELFSRSMSEPGVEVPAAHARRAAAAWKFVKRYINSW
ncbi:3-dehydroshikimate dehydratase [Phaeosphaeriaceae sp. PMI808]|nr:3-dehydroshikimate dehydratase [Phaeosphaeriaceae sp. PMI808]